MGETEISTAQQWFEAIAKLGENCTDAEIQKFLAETLDSDDHEIFLALPRPDQEVVIAFFTKLTANERKLITTASPEASAYFPKSHEILGLVAHFNSGIKQP